MERRVWGGIVGPVAFVAAWVIGSIAADDYSAVDDAISRLAAVDADTRWLMSAGFVIFGVGVSLFALTLPRPLSITLAIAGLATLGVAATPLDQSESIDRWHGFFAVIGYIALALSPILGARQMRPPLNRVSIAIGAVAGICLALTAVSDANGLFQRIGLTVCDMWIVALAVQRRDQPP